MSLVRQYEAQGVTLTRGEKTGVKPPAVTSRAAIPNARRIVIKVGSSSLTRPDGHLDLIRVRELSEAIAVCRTRGQEVVLVSSGAQAAAMGPLGLKQKPRTLSGAQAAASVGQGLLIAEYTRQFAELGYTVGQVLLTAEDVLRKTNYKNARRALDELLRLGVVPIVNENDTVATDEIRFGDNDRLAALTAHLIHADVLVLLTDVDALYDRNPRLPDAKKIDVIHSFTEAEQLDVGSRGSAFGTGGMVTKIQAAAIAMSSGVPVLLTSAASVHEALRGEDVGTWFETTATRLPARQLWLAYAADIKGRIYVDEGAARAVTDRNASLLPAGVLGSEGNFRVGDAVEIATEDGTVIARGTAGFSAPRIPQIAGLSMNEVEQILEERYAHEVVHRDELVVMARHRRTR
ncbi:glutamate 5-kinase [Actinomyces minihominis]|uniref:glutamate 5-kinase n=1 Tax=Actinomyces minihominis TaxID=2002838 RepID=UPI000C0877B3|nr:glutamate 5-kinase [Actinomyces minihominis]